MVRIILLTLLLLTVSVPTSFAADNSKILGSWALDLIMQGGAITVQLIFSQSEDGLQGQWIDPIASSELTNVSFDGTTVKFTRTGEVLGAVEMTLVLENDQLKGEMPTQLGPLQFSATRAEAP